MLIRADDPFVTFCGFCGVPMRACGGHPRVSLHAGDTVFHRPTGETWVVQSVQGEYLSWYGYPPGRALVADCDLVEETQEPPPSGWHDRPGLF